MNGPDAFPEEWRSAREAESLSLARRHDLKARSDFKEIILLALSTLSEQDAALRFLRDDALGLSDAQLIDIAPVVMDIAVDGNIDNLVTARAVLQQYASHFLDSRKIVEMTLDRRLDGYLASEDGFLYRRLAELLVAADFPDALAKLMSVCKDSSNPDIAEIHDDLLKSIAHRPRQTQRKA